MAAAEIDRLIVYIGVKELVQSLIRDFGESGGQDLT